MSTRTVYGDGKSDQYDDTGKDDAIPSGQSPTLYKVNPDVSVTPNTTGYTTSKNQLTTSGK
jgi:hypothetical protein